jgi:hypothetical protein
VELELVSIPAANVYPKILFTQSRGAGAGPITISFDANLIFVITFLACSCTSTIPGDSAQILLSGTVVCQAIIQNTPKAGDTPVAALDTRQCDLPCAEGYEFELISSAAGFNTFTAAGYTWAHRSDR